MLTEFKPISLFEFMNTNYIKGRFPDDSEYIIEKDQLLFTYGTIFNIPNKGLLLNDEHRLNYQIILQIT
jgi:hypothetical protein